MKRLLTRNTVLFLVTAVLFAATCGLAMQLRHRTDRPTAAPTPSAAPGPQIPARSGSLLFERIGNPARTVARDPSGTVVATFTDGARTAVLTGPGRTFAEPRTTDAKVVTKSWVRLLPAPWTQGVERSGWFGPWLKSRLADRRSDILATAFEYVAGAPTRTTAAGVAYSGAARYTPDTTGGSARTGSDFYDYLGVPWTFPDTVVRSPEKDRARSVDSSGYVRLVYGYRAGVALNSRDNATGGGLQRSPDGIARGRLGVPVLPLTDRRPAAVQQLQPGDLVFFRAQEQSGKRIDHIGIYLGLDTADHPRFISSRKNAGGPTMGDKGGTSQLDGGGYYAQALRAARRI
ncbi:NlpC/P60 family protein [Streptomyces acidiscabies]|uniref:NlpC/P60 family protein n=1 Tax=Streptomyces acidiscabies TaxID=42234 RepID=A0AAP6B715_9ACTN|nr:NlpC/P60 family protein [Streptomyces acidiscabies]MDX2959259.1 NlpC/P60 family protein [Streptomyces acidiscabies]MDX3017597.1 NlpC/P60 family protein [Streptomyces acidiscabies]MDX3788072.1 NlpC/P60 family protein [Streptomyces acidiscabies]GAQ55289.1 NlpC/P60 family protein [Streptomyces acidiscabies]GAV40536.1 NlpC/P60 family protein [Streptomyces acidiscabies]